MSNAYNEAHALARAIKESDAFKQLKSIKGQINQDPSTKKMLDDFQQRQMELQMRHMQGEEIPEEELEKANKLFEVLQLNLTIKRYLEAEQRFALLMEDINKIITEPLEEIYQEGE